MSQGVLAGSETVSVVCAVTTDEAPIEELHRRIKSAMQSISPAVDFEILFVDDGTDDDTVDILADLAEQDAHIGVIRLSRRFGRDTAVIAGIDHAEGDAVVILDPYLQDPPEVIAEMVAKWREGWDVVCGQPSSGSSDFRLMSRRVVEVLRSTNDGNRYSRDMLAWSGFAQHALAYEHDVQRPTPSKSFGFLHTAVAGPAVLSNKPLRLASTLGLVVTAAAFVATFVLIIRKVIDPSAGTAGYASMMTVVLFLGGVQLLTIGILGQYLGRTYTEVKRRPLYVVSERYTVDQPTADPDKTVIALDSGSQSVALSDSEHR